MVFKALCTEAALNAIQRRYPQVYKSNDRLLLKPETIGVGLRDFMISIKSECLLLPILGLASVLLNVLTANLPLVIRIGPFFR